ncbi:MAG: N-acetyltransferase [Bacteroidia bacterium]|nr:N-acetyltransferase [Bacteroidia bacterium]
MELKTVYFRAIEPDDVEYIYIWMNDHEMMKDAVGMPRPKSMQECREWTISSSNHNPYSYSFAICTNDNSKKIIGYMTLTNIHFVNSSVETGAIVIGDRNYRDGITWIESVLYLHYFTFEILHLNRLYGSHLLSQKVSHLITDLFFWKNEGILRQAVYKNGEYQDLSIDALLKDEYFKHKNNGEYIVSSVIKRLKVLRKNKRII